MVGKIVTQVNNDVIILGDFNCDMSPSKRDTASNSLQSIMSVLLFYQLIDIPTRETPSSKSIIDVIYCRDKDNHSTTGVFTTYFSDHYLVFTPHLCLGTKTCKVEKISIGSGKEVYAIFRLVEGKRQQHREESVKECWGKHASLFHSTLYWEWIWGGTIILNRSSHTFVEGCNYLHKLGGTSNSLEESERSISANQVEGFC